MKRGDLDLGDRDFRRVLSLLNGRLRGPGAATASDARRRTGAVFLAGLLVDRAGLWNDQRGHARRAEREKSDDGREGEPLHNEEFSIVL